MSDMTPEAEFRLEMALNVLNSKSLRKQIPDFSVDPLIQAAATRQILVNQENIMLMLLHKLGGVDIGPLLEKRDAINVVQPHKP